MKKFLKIFVPIVLAIAIIAGVVWYLLIYDQNFTRDMLLQSARHFENSGDLDTASWFYDLAYQQGSGSDEIAVELARQYMDSDNFTQAEVTLNKAIRDGGGAQVYIALCKAYVEQDKLLDAVDLLDKITDPAIKQELDGLRPEAPVTAQAPGFYNQYISVTVESTDSTLYVNAYGEYPSVNKDLYTQPITLQDGENVLYALAVADSGLVSPLSIFGYTVGGVVEEITFEDPVLEQHIRSILSVSEDTTLFSNDLWTIKEFTVPADASTYGDMRYMVFLEKLTIEKGVSGQLQVLANLSNLKELHITDTTVSADELQIIGTLTALEKLTLNTCTLSTTEGLEKLTALSYLNLSNNTIRNISALSAMVELKELYMKRNALQDLSALSSCTVLSKLDVSYNALTSFAPVANLPLLTYMDISHNQIADMSNAAFMTALTELRANNNYITDIGALANCAQLTYIDISNNQITSLTSLELHDTLTYLNFSYNQVSDLPNWSSECQLVTIDGAYNLISDLSPLANLQHINNILMDYNENISSVSALAKCPVLIQVNIYGTKVKDVKELTDQSIIVNYNPV